MQLKPLIEPAGDSEPLNDCHNKEINVSNSIARLRAMILPSSSVFISLLLSVPIISLIFLGLSGTSVDIWQHLSDTVLTTYIVNSLILIIGVAIGTFLLGVSCAWLTAMYDFPGKKYFIWLLLLPLAFPGYIIAFTYSGLLDVSGPVQGLLRELTGLGVGEYTFPNIRSIMGAIFILSLVLYPYVYMLARAAFLEQSVCVLEASQSLGSGTFESFFSIALPLARPAIVAGVSLAVLETLADFGTMDYFGISTFSTGIFRTWFGLNDIVTAAQLSIALLVIVFAFILIERYSRRKARFHHTTERYQNIIPKKLSTAFASMAFFICFIPVLFGFLIPVFQLITWVVKTWNTSVNENFIHIVVNSFYLASLASLFALVLSLCLVYSRRLYPIKLIFFTNRFATLGYTIPGVVITVAIMLPIGDAEKMLNDLILYLFDIRLGLILSGSVAILIFAYLVRFLSVSLQTLEASLDKIKISIDEVARTLGSRTHVTLVKIHFPIMRGSILTALLVVFVEVLKELPITLVMRPFNFNTLSVRAYELASDERLADASLSALGIVLVGLLPIIIISKFITNSRQRQS